MDTYDEYYAVHDHIWRRAVERSQRHGMLCLSCLERRLGRGLQPEDFKAAPVNAKVAQFLAQRPASAIPIVPAADASTCVEFDDSPMGWDDYGIIDEIAADADKLSQIDAALISLVTAKPRKVAGIIGRTLASPAHVPGLPDVFYLERVRLLVEAGVLEVVGDLDDLMKCEVYLP
jgi:hypothetical protein